MRSSTASAPWICSTKDNNSVNTIPFMTNSLIRAATNRIDCIIRPPNEQWLESLKLKIDAIQFDAGVLGCELPMCLGIRVISGALPSRFLRRGFRCPGCGGSDCGRLAGDFLQLCG